MASSLELDLDTIIKASQALVSEINLDELLKKIMQRVMENAGADKGLLILQTEEKWYIEAACGVDGTDMQVLQFHPHRGQSATDASWFRRFLHDPNPRECSSQQCRAGRQIRPTSGKQNPNRFCASRS